MQKALKNRKYQIVLFESFGTFLLTYGISSASLHSAPDFMFASTLFLAICLIGQITGGYVNPIIAIATKIDKRHKKLALYLTAQIIGGLFGGILAWLLLGKVDIPYHEENLTIQQLKFILNEFIGATFFSICMLTITNKLTSHAVKSWQIYLSVPVALYLVRKMTGSTCLNPAVGLALQIISAIQNQNLIMFLNSWMLILPAALGAILGGTVMTKIYEPLLLSIRHKEMVNEDKSEQ